MKEYKKIHIFLFAFFIIGVSSLLMIKSIQSFDYWWHIKAGEYIVANKVIPFTDVFSWFGIENNLYWHSHEWLSEVLLYLFYSVFDNFGAYIFTIGLFLSISLLLFLLNKDKYYKNIRISIIWIILGVLILVPIALPRPHMINLMLFLLVIYILFDYKKHKSKKIWILPLISILWVNFHGGSSNLIYIMIFMFIITGLFDFKIGRITAKKLENNQIKTLIIVAILSILALLINPHGLDMITYPYSNMADSYMLSFIDEWRSPDLKKFSDLFVFIEIFLIGIILIIDKDKDIDLLDFLLEGAFIYLTFKSIRFSAFLYIISSFIIFKYINESKDKEINKQLSIGLGIIGIILTIFSLFNISSIASQPIKEVVSNDIIQTIKEEAPKRLYNAYNVGGYLIYNDIPVFVDGRADMYSAGGNIQDAINLSSMLCNPEEIINKYKFDLFLIYKSSPLDYYFNTADNYISINEDDTFIIYKKIES